MRFGYIAIEKGKGWFVPQNFSGIVEVDLSSYKSKFLTRLNGYSIFNSCICGAIQKKDNLLAVAPMSGEHLYIYHIKESRLTKFPLRELGSNKRTHNGCGKFRYSFCKDNAIYFVGYGYPGIIKIDVEREQIRVIDSDIEKSNSGAWGWIAGVTDENIYIPLFGRQELIIFNMENEEYRIQRIRKSCYMAVNGNEHDLCLFPEYGRNLEVYDIDKWKWKRQINLPEKFAGEEKSHWYCAAFFHCGYIWIFPSKSNMILRLELQKGEFVCIKKFDNIEEQKYLNAGIYDDNQVWGFYQKENRLDIIDCRSLQIRQKYISAPDNISEYICSKEDWNIYADHVRAESELGVSLLISIVCRQDASLQKYIKEKNTGSNIWERL